jgi:hypothetical protein
MQTGQPARKTQSHRVQKGALGKRRYDEEALVPNHNILILGASYGSLLACKLVLGGHDVRLVCRAQTAALINAEGFRVRMPVKGRALPLEVDSRHGPGRVSASAPDEVEPRDYDLVCLAMQEPQYRSPDVRGLLEGIAKAGVPCMSIMNMPPPCYLKRIRGINTHVLASAYTDPTLWSHFDPDLVTLCSPDPQAIRLPDEKANVLQLTLATNFKVARFASEEHTAMLRRLADDIEAVRYATDAGPVELPVKLKVHDSLFTPLAKWAMLLTGNYRCVTAGGAITIRDAVHADLAESRAVYDFVRDLCIRLGAAPDDLVPFEKYAAAAASLTRPSSAARAVFAGATHIERADRLVQLVASQHGLRHPVIDATVALVSGFLAENRQAAA